MKIILSIAVLAVSLFAKELPVHKHKHTHTDCEKPIIFDETELEKVFELKGKVYKVLKGDDTNPTILYVMDPKTKKFVRIKQQ